jgi:hypothetical protein
MPQPTRFFDFLLCTLTKTRVLRLSFVAAFCIVANTSFAADLTFTDHTVTIHGLTPLGNIAVCGIVLEPQGYESRIVKVMKVVTADANGTFSHTTPASIDRSVWFAVDLTTGTVAKGKSQHSRAEIIDALTEREPLRAGMTEFSRRGSFLFVMVVRPGTGVWGIEAGDGGVDDGDGASNARITVSLSRLKSLVGAIPAPVALAPGDSVVAIDPYSLRIFAARLPLL